MSLKESVFITGGSSGIGLALAHKYKSEGYRVGICGRSADKLEKLKDEFETFQADISDNNQIKNAIESFGQGGLDILIANAGGSDANKKRIPDFELSRRTIKNNVLGTMNTMEHAVNYMLKQKRGKLVVVSSVAAFYGFPGISAYSASKAAVARMCESFQTDLVPFGIETICVYPGFVKTPLTDQNRHPMPFMISADKAANIIFKGVKQGKRKIYFPKIFCLIVGVIASLPSPIYHMLMKIKFINYSKKES